MSNKFFMKKVIRIERGKDSTYSLVGGVGDDLDIFRIFLTDDVALNGGQKFRDWALSKKEGFCSGGESTNVKKENNRIYIYSIWDYDDDDPPCANLSIEAFVSGIDQWNALIKIEPKYITIQEENGVILIEGSELNATEDVLFSATPFAEC